MTAKEILDKFKELAAQNEELEFRSFADGGYDDLLESHFGSYEMVDETINEEDGFRREWITVQFFDHNNVLVQEIKTYEDDELTSTEYWKAVAKEVKQILYNPDEEII